MSKKKPFSPTARILLHGMILQNPVLVQVVGLCPAVAAAADLYVSGLLSALVTGLLLVSECIACLLLKKIPRRIRVAIYFVLGLLVCAEAAFFLEQNAPELRERAGVYLPLMAASSLVALRCEKIAVKQKLRVAFLDAFANGIGFSTVLLLSGFLRGLLGSGRIGDLILFRNPPLAGLALPFGGFLILGFMAAFLKWFSSVALGQKVQMAFGIRRKSRKAEPVVQERPAPAQDAPPAGETAPANEPEPPLKPAEPPTDDAEQEPDLTGGAEQFYEQASDNPQKDITDDLFAELDRSVQAELDDILQSLNNTDTSPAEGGSADDA